MTIVGTLSPGENFPVTPGRKRVLAVFIREKKAVEVYTV
jgi:hypothetical protein